MSKPNWAHEDSNLGPCLMNSVRKDGKPVGYFCSSPENRSSTSAKSCGIPETSSRGFPVASWVTIIPEPRVGAMTDEVLTIARSTESRGQAAGTDRSRLDGGAAWWQRPKAQAGCRDYGSDGSSSGRSRRSPRTSDDASSCTRAADNVRTVAPLIDSRARTQASSELAPS